MVEHSGRLRGSGAGVQNKIDFTQTPEAVFLDPWQDPGFQFLLEPEFIWKVKPAARISGFAASVHAPLNKKIKDALRMIQRNRGFANAFEYHSVPVVLDQAGFRKSFVSAQDKMILSGAAGTRAINRFRRDQAKAGLDGDALIETFFTQCRARNEKAEIPVYSGVLEPDIHFAVPCRNTFNYFHFITESLSQLTLLDGLDFPGNIYFHFPNSEDRQKPFARAFVDALFPEFAGRVFFERAPKDYDRVLTGYDLIGGHFQGPSAHVAGMDRHLPRAVLDKGGSLALASRVPLAVNAVNSTLFALRDRALRAIEGMNFDHLPKRFFVGRDTRQSRARHIEGEDILFDHLRLFGFEYVVFESLSPLEQIGLMAHAEMMVSYHGAGFTNMLFANPDAFVIEIGTLQTAQIRWGDFWPLAHAAQCSYVTFFTDFKSENPMLEPKFSQDSLVPASLNAQSVGQIMALIVSLFGHYPDLETARTLEELARELVQVGAPDRALALLEKHQAMVPADRELCLIMADCHKNLDDPKSELVALDLAYKADPDRWQTLIRIVWCANRCERPQVIRWALARLKRDFPQRHEVFLANHDWVRYVA